MGASCGEVPPRVSFYQLVQGIARKLHRAKIDAVLLKLDITKAFDTMDWAFLLEVLRKLGFGER